MRISTEFKGKVKQKLWVRPTCTDDSEPFRLSQKARADFKHHCREEGSIDVAAAVLLDEVFELGDALAEDRHH